MKIGGRLRNFAWAGSHANVTKTRTSYTPGLKLIEEVSMQSKDHWEQVYSTKSSDSVSWFESHAETSTRLIRETGLGRAQPSLMSGQVHPPW